MKIAVVRTIGTVMLGLSLSYIVLGAEPRLLVAEEKLPNGLTINMPNIDVQDQDGVNQKFLTDVIGNKLVAINFIFTTCTAVCPTQSLILRKLQDQLGSELGNEFGLISVSIDPKRDIPYRLKIYAQERGAKPGWQWITGEKGNIDQILSAAGIPRGEVTDHPAMILLGDPQSGEWIRFYGFPKAEQLLKGLKQLQTQRRRRDA
jgi:protein SCO1